jgi:hypothetical protein
MALGNFKKLDEFVGQRKEYPYPDEDQNPKLKLEKDYYLNYGRAMVGDFTNNACELPYAFGKNKRSFKELHEYATGSYPNSKIKDQLIGTSPAKKKNGKHITKMNISFDTLPVVSKMLDVMQEKNMRQTYDVDCFCLDDDSIQAKDADKAMLKYLVQEETVELMRRTKFKPNVKIDPQAIGLQTEQDVDLYFECGAYIFDREIATIAACNKTKLVSNYKVVQDGTFLDLIKFGIAIWKNEIDITTNTVKLRKCEVYNPELDRCAIILPYSNTNNFENLSKFGEIRTLTVLDIRKECPWLKGEQILYLAECYSYLNPEYSSLISSVSTNNSAMGYNLDPINRCKILVLDYQWLGVDIENYLKNERRGVFTPKDYDFKLSSDAKRKGDRQIQKRVVKRYSAKWVIGTDILLSYGTDENIIYYGPDGDRCPGLDVFATKTGNGSLIERCIAIQDDIDLANVKLRNALASAIPSPRMVVQTGLLDNVFLNGIKQQPQDNMATFRELGYLLVNAVDDDGKPIFTNQKLVDFLPMGIQEDINVFTGQILAGINNIREVLGIAQGADGSTPQKYDGVRKTELSAQSSNAALFPTFNCFQYLFEDAFNDVVKKWQIIAKDSDIKLNYSSLGQKNLKVLSLDEKFTNADLNIVLTLGATDQELTDLLNDIKQLKALGVQTGFNQGITTSEYIYLSETIKSGNTKQAMWVMAKVEQKKIAAQKLIDEQNQQNNTASQQNSAAQAELNKQQTEQIKGQQNRLTIVLQEALKMKTAASTGILNTYDSENDPAPLALYQKMIDDANSEIVGVLKQDGVGQLGDQQQGQQAPPDGPQQQPEMQQPQQQVA